MNAKDPLLLHIEAHNAKSKAWEEANPGSWASQLVTDLDHWHRYGVFTPEDFDRYLLVSDIYETTRSLWGYKPDWAVLMRQTTEDLQHELECLDKISKENYEKEIADKTAKAAAIGVDLETYERYLQDAEDAAYPCCVG